MFHIPLIYTTGEFEFQLLENGYLQAVLIDCKLQDCLEKYLKGSPHYFLISKKADQSCGNLFHATVVGIKTMENIVGKDKLAKGIPEGRFPYKITGFVSVFKPE